MHTQGFIRLCICLLHGADPGRALGVFSAYVDDVSANASARRNSISRPQFRRRGSGNRRRGSAAQVLYDFDFDWRHMVRGLTIDKRRGNVLKLDRHKYVKLAYHGFQKLSREQRLATYANALVRSLQFCPLLQL